MKFMKFIRRNMLILAILGGFLVLLLGSAWFLYEKIAERQTVEADLAEKKEKLQTLLTRAPFPSQKNVKLVEEMAREHAALIDEATATLRKKELSFEDIEGPKFRSELVIAKRRMLATLNRRDLEIKVPAKFEFAFDRYAERPPAKEHTHMLLKQLQIIEELMKMVADSRFDEILSLRRVEAEDSIGAPPSSGAGDPASQPLISQSGKFDYADFSAYMYTAMPFDLELKGDSESLHAFLNALASSPYVFLPRLMNIENEKQEATTKEATERFKKEERLPPSRPGVSPEEAAAEAANAGPRYVFGEEKIKVNIRIDWIEFRSDKTADKNHGKSADKSSAQGPSGRRRRGGAEKPPEPVPSTTPEKTAEPPPAAAPEKPTEEKKPPEPVPSATPEKTAEKPSAGAPEKAPEPPPSAPLEKSTEKPVTPPSEKPPEPAPSAPPGKPAEAPPKRTPDS